jgi:hypothetical protein
MEILGVKNVHCHPGQFRCQLHSHFLYTSTKYQCHPPKVIEKERKTLAFDSTIHAVVRPNRDTSQLLRGVRCQSRTCFVILVLRPLACRSLAWPEGLQLVLFLYFLVGCRALAVISRYPRFTREFTS